MAKVALNIRDVADQQALSKAAKGYNACAGAQLQNPTPAEVTVLQAAVAAFESALSDVVAKEQAYQTAVAAKNQKRAAMEAAYADVGKIVDKVAKGDKAVIFERGYDAVREGAPVTMVPVTNLAVTAGDAEGTVRWTCDPQKGAMYLLEVSPDVVPRSWVKQDPARKSSGRLTGLPPATRQWLRVAAKGSHNTGGWSDPALVTVP